MVDNQLEGVEKSLAQPSKNTMLVAAALAVLGLIIGGLVAVAVLHFMPAQPAYSHSFGGCR